MLGVLFFGSMDGFLFYNLKSNNTQKLGRALSSEEVLTQSQSFWSCFRSPETDLGESDRFNPRRPRRCSTKRSDHQLETTWLSLRSCSSVFRVRMSSPAYLDAPSLSQSLYCI
ncbi:hypothetical protein RND71_014237 [Anisodus tanguticus]|uniref:Uncharacterized protein n=1 Tax=Anisodus tanguticus TaxID=243964 RepID=A0AAE1SAZ7_9SOLA|nr:hypothetical protein RND71_014237 [Anisodus tanguticus]